MARRPLMLIVLIALLAFAVPARADQAADLAARMKDLQVVTAAVRVLDKGTGLPLAAEQSALADASKQQRAAAVDLLAKYADFKKRIDAATRLVADHNKLAEHLNAQIEGHNKRCADKHADAKACRAEGETLTSRSSALNADGASLDDAIRDLVRGREGLDASNETLKAKLIQLQKDSEKWEAGRRAYVAKRRELVVAYDQAVGAVQGAAAEVQACVDRLPLNAGDKVIKLACGNVPFDDVRKNLRVIANWPRDTVLELRLD